MANELQASLSGGFVDSSPVARKVISQAVVEIFNAYRIPVPSALSAAASAATANTHGAATGKDAKRDATAFLAALYSALETLEFPSLPPRSDVNNNDSTVPLSAFRNPNLVAACVDFVLTELQTARMAGARLQAAAPSASTGNYIDASASSADTAGTAADTAVLTGALARTLGASLLASSQQTIDSHTTKVSAETAAAVAADATAFAAAASTLPDVPATRPAPVLVAAHVAGLYAAATGLPAPRPHAATLAHLRQAASALETALNNSSNSASIKGAASTAEALWPAPALSLAELTPLQREVVDLAAAALNDDYSLRRAVMLQRLKLSAQGMLWGVRDAAKRAQIAAVYADRLAAVQTKVALTAADLALVGPQVVAVRRVTDSSAPAHALLSKARVRSVVMGDMPDRGGRTKAFQMALEMPRYVSLRDALTFNFIVMHSLLILS